MNLADEATRVAEAARRAYLDAGIAWPPPVSGPMPLNELFMHRRIGQEEVDRLTLAVVGDRLARWNVRGSAAEADEPLAGFLYANRRSSHVFVNRGDRLPRRRFSAAQELGHYHLDFLPKLEGRDVVEENFADPRICESEQAELNDVERRANRFAAEVLMPEPVCRDLCDRHIGKHGTTPRFLVYRLASDLLVSREAIGWRFHDLGIIPRPTWLKAARGDEDVAEEETP